jgi:mono/diheme cytochrome c family protein
MCFYVERARFLTDVARGVLITSVATVLAFAAGFILSTMVYSEASAPVVPVEVVAPPPAAPATPTEAHAPLAGTELRRATALFKANCAECHLSSGKGSLHHHKDNIPDFTDPAWYTDKTDEELLDTIQNGKGEVMPPFKDELSADEISLLIHYVHGFPERTPVTPRKKASTGDSRPAAPPREEHTGHHH